MYQYVCWCDCVCVCVFAIYKMRPVRLSVLICILVRVCVCVRECVCARAVFVQLTVLLNR